jgi:hypothetical protein
MSKPATLVARRIYSHRKQIKTNYKGQFPTNPMLNDEIEKKINWKKDTKNNSSQLRLTR